MSWSFLCNKYKVESVWYIMVMTTYSSWTLMTLCTMGMSLPLMLNTTISPTLIGSFCRLVRNSRSPRWNAGSILPLWVATNIFMQRCSTEMLFVRVCVCHKERRKVLNAWFQTEPSLRAVSSCPCSWNLQSL